MTNGGSEAAGSRKVIATTCVTHPGAPGFCNLEVVKVGGDIVFRPHVTGACVVTMDEAEARELHAWPGEMLDDPR